MANNPYVNKVVYDGTTLIDITDSTATESDVAEGVVFYKADGTRSVGTMARAYSFVGMVVQGTNLSTEADVKAIYGSNTSWTLISSVALASEHVFGNGKAMAMTDGSSKWGLRGNVYNSQSMVNGNTNVYGQNLSTSGTSGGSWILNGNIGSPTKAQLGSNLDYSGLIADTFTVYTWERTA